MTIKGKEGKQNQQNMMPRVKAQADQVYRRGHMKVSKELDIVPLKSMCAQVPLQKYMLSRYTHCRFFLSIFFIKFFLCGPFSLKSLLNFFTILFLLFFLNKFIYLFMATLGLCCCARAFSSCCERGLLFIAVCGLLIAVDSLLVEHGLWACGLSSCGSRALEHRLTGCGTQA